MNKDYSEMGRRSWKKFEQTHGKVGARKEMAKKGNKGWLALVDKLGSEKVAKEYCRDLRTAIYFRSTRPGFAQEKMSKYFEVFPSLKTKFTGEKL